MTVLMFIGVFLFMWLIYFFIRKINSFSFRKYNYGFFSSELFFLYCIIYALLFFGYDLYVDAVKENGDILNGILIFVFGVILLAIRLVLNIKIAKFFLGLFFTIVQFFIFIPIAFGGLVILMIILLIASQIKPVFNVNSK
ncbi:hypothetical protein [Arcobacter sp. L]|uniref:hypothetical protein n=1 Tax=Arcobacter sp. L TaxID=944547 RepID=UPI0002295EDA|nr:hypothetical protein [Arcobacter sp. L]BAK72788.1 hypothetical protein ABLL_0913 [Arcobacter sp. L]